MKYDLLSVGQDAKTVKGERYGYRTAIVYLSPATEANGIDNLCINSTEQCRLACLYRQGMAGVYPSIIRNRVRKTLEYLDNPKAFTERLIVDVSRFEKNCRQEGMKPAVRINGTSDVPKLARVVAGEHSRVPFYDYTKLDKPWLRVGPNYHLTFSHSGQNIPQCFEALKRGINVAVVFHDVLPATWHGIPVINGDASDLRFRDPVGVIVGLKAKGTARKMATGGFIQIGGVA